MVEIRDRLVAVVLAAGLLLGMVGWQGVGPWLGIGIGVVAAVVASAIYRIDPTGRGPSGDTEDDLRSEPSGGVSTRRRAAGRP